VIAVLWGRDAYGRRELAGWQVALEELDGLLDPRDCGIHLIVNDRARRWASVRGAREELHKIRQRGDVLAGIESQASRLQDAIVPDLPPIFAGQHMVIRQDRR